MSAADWLRYAEATPAGTPDNSLTAIANAVTGLLAAVVETADRDREERVAYRLHDRADAAIARVLEACDDIEARSLGDVNLRTAAAQVRAAIDAPSERERAEAWVREHAADDAPFASLRRQVEQIEEANRRAGHPVPEGALICLPYPEARALLDAIVPPAANQEAR